jgi:NAD(P) transhydrogenase subunit beta
MSNDLVALLYLAAGVLFVLALRGLSSPETSRRGNYLGMAGMAIAVATTLAVARPSDFTTWAMIIGGIAIGGSIGALIARRIPDDGDARAGRRLPFAGRHGGGAGRRSCLLCA